MVFTVIEIISFDSVYKNGKVFRLTTRQGNATRLKHVDIVALSHGDGLIRGQSCVRKHANLSQIVSLCHHSCGSGYSG